MPRRKTLQTSFIAGEIAPELGRRADTKQYQNGAKLLRNYRCLIGGGVTRRPGLRRLTILGGTPAPRLIDFIFNDDDQYILAFTPHWMVAYREDGTQAGQIAGSGPWDETTLYEFDWMQTLNTMIVTHPRFGIHIIQRTSATTWELRTFTFFPSGPRTEQPYIKLASFDTTLLVDNVTGATALATNKPWFQAGHVGQIIRYLGREIRITAVDNATEAHGTILEQLPGTRLLTVTDSSGFTLGETVEGSNSGARGVIAQIPSAGTVLIYQRAADIRSVSGSGGSISSRDATGNETLASGPAQVSLQEFQPPETLIGPHFTSPLTAVAVAAPAPVPDWDEQLIGNLWGYPACVALHRNRLCFAGHPAIPNLLMCSRINNLFSFETGDASDADAILELIGDASAAVVRQLYSAEQLLLATDRGLYYVPENPASPFRPTSMSFVAFGSPWPINRRVKLRPFDGGVLCVSGNLVLKATPTGDLQRSWRAEEVSLLSPHLLNSPFDLAVTTNFEGGPERYAIFPNVDGTLAIMQLVENQEIRNFTQWFTAGHISAVCTIRRQLFASVLRFGQQYLEVFDSRMTLDNAMMFADEFALGGVPALFPSAPPIVPHVVVGAPPVFSLGPYPPTVPELPLGPYWVGYNYSPILQTLPPLVEGPEGNKLGELVRMKEAYVYTHNSYRFAVNGLELTAYQVHDVPDAPPPIRTGPERFQFLGWRRDPVLSIAQPDPLPLTILAVKTEIAF